jgi:hypothetical protein
VIAEALSNGIPVIVGINVLNLSAFQEFAGGMAVNLAPESGRLADWVSEKVATTIETN